LVKLIAAKSIALGTNSNSVPQKSKLGGRAACDAGDGDGDGEAGGGGVEGVEAGDGGDGGGGEGDGVEAGDGEAGGDGGGRAACDAGDGDSDSVRDRRISHDRRWLFEDASAVITTAGCSGSAVGSQWSFNTGAAA